MADELLTLLALPISSLCCACRLCATVIDPAAAVSIFEGGENHPDLDGKIKKYLPINVEETDPFSKTVCKLCAELLIKFHDLSQKCILFDEHLRRTLESCTTDDIDVEAELSVGLDCLEATANVQFDIEELDYLESKLPAEENGNIESSGVLCQVCGDTLPSFDQCLLHQKAHINTNKRCVVCGFKNVSDLEINIHLLKHFGENVKENKVSPEECPVKEQCLKCEKGLSNIENAVEHCKTHRPTDVFSYSCVLCLETVTIDNLQTHMSHHFEVKSCPLSCDGCQNEYPDEKTLKYHRCVQLQKYKCSQCKQGFKTEGRLKFHEEFHLNKKTFCDICKKDFKFESRIYIHMTGAHHGERDNPFCCDKCGRTFRWLKTLRTHQLTHSNSRPFACRKCDARFGSKASLRTHKSSHEAAQRLHCLRCDYTTCRKLNLIQHVDRFHKQLDDFQVVVRCRGCEEVFPNSLHVELEGHSHGYMEEGFSLEELTVSKLYQCERCDRNFASGDHLAIHREKHAHDDSFSIYHCRLCEVGFKKHDLLVRHQRVHASIISQYTGKFCVLTVNPCDLCGLECVDYTQLITHKERSNCLEKVKSGKAVVKKALIASRLRPLKLQDLNVNAEGLFECVTCSRTYKSRRRYRLHIATHSA